MLLDGQLGVIREASEEIEMRDANDEEDDNGESNSGVGEDLDINTADRKGEREGKEEKETLIAHPPNDGATPLDAHHHLNPDNDEADQRSRSPSVEIEMTTKPSDDSPASTDDSDSDSDSDADSLDLSDMPEYNPDHDDDSDDDSPPDVDDVLNEDGDGDTGSKDEKAGGGGREREKEDTQSDTTHDSDKENKDPGNRSGRDVQQQQQQQEQEHVEREGHPHSPQKTQPSSSSPWDSTFSDPATPSPRITEPASPPIPKISSTPKLRIITTPRKNRPPLRERSPSPPLILTEVEELEKTLTEKNTLLNSGLITKIAKRKSFPLNALWRLTKRDRKILRAVHLTSLGKKTKTTKKVGEKEVKRLIKQGKYLSGKDVQEGEIVKVRVGEQRDYMRWLRSFEGGGRTSKKKKRISFSKGLKVRKFFRGEIIGSNSESNIESGSKGFESKGEDGEGKEGEDAGMDIDIDVVSQT